MLKTEHLPECPVEKMLRSGRTVGSQSCICEHLRACEERIYSRDIFMDARKKGHANGLGEAEAALRQLETDMRNWSSDETRAATDEACHHCYRRTTKGRSAMTEHLPECWVKHESDPKAWCICDELRACEQRVREEHRHRCSGCDWCYTDGVREAIDAAREAVAALPEYRMRDTCIAAIEQLREEKK